MRAGLVLLLVALVAGCANAPARTTTPATSANATTQEAGLPNATLAPVGERGPTVTEHFVMTSDHAIAFRDPSQGELPMAKVPESFTGVGFFAAGESPDQFKPWGGPTAQRTFEVFGDVPITVRFTAAQSGATATKGFQLPPVGGWFGSKDRWAVFFTATDAPDTIEAGKTYTVKMIAKMPATGFFMRAGDSLALRTYLGYQTADNSPVSYVVGGPEAAGFDLPHVHFNISAPKATVLLEKSGTLSPNPSQTTTQDPQPTDLTLDLPAGTVYLVADLVGSATGGSSEDVDLTLRAGTAVLGAGVGPSAHEVVELGPTSLAAASGKIVAHVAGAGASGGTFKLTVTAYGP